RDRNVTGVQTCALPILPSTAHRPGGEKAIAAFMEQYLAASASALGISETELKTDLKNGQSLSQIAAARNVTQATFRTKVIANLKDRKSTRLNSSYVSIS